MKSHFEFTNLYFVYFDFANLGEVSMPKTQLFLMTVWLQSCQSTEATLLDAIHVYYNSIPWALFLAQGFMDPLKLG